MSDLSRAERRRIKRKLHADADRVALVSNADRLWFEAHPNRQIHVRQARPVEIEEVGVINGAAAARVPDGWELATFVIRLEPGIRTRISAPVFKGLIEQLDRNEGAAREVAILACPAQFRDFVRGEKHAS